MGKKLCRFCEEYPACPLPEKGEGCAEFDWATWDAVCTIAEYRSSEQQALADEYERRLAEKHP